MRDFNNYKLKTLEYCSLLNSKLELLSNKNFIYARAYANELEAILKEIKDRMTFVCKFNEDSFEILNYIKALENSISEFKTFSLITDEIKEDFEKIRQTYFPVNEEYSHEKYTAAIKNICEINKIKIKNSFNTYIEKNYDGWEISYIPHNNYFINKMSLFFGIFHILLFNDAKPMRQSSYYIINNDERNIVISKCITHIFHPDSLFEAKAHEFNYDACKLSNFFDFSESLMRVKLMALK